jgi:hypothetical protein
MSEQVEVKISFHFAIIHFYIKIYFTLAINNARFKQIYHKYPLEFTCNVQFIKRVGQSFYILGELNFFSKHFQI